MERASLFWDHLLRQNKSTTHGKTNRDWWPNQLRLNILHQNSLENNPMRLTLIMLKNLKVRFRDFKNDIKEVITTSQDWWYLWKLRSLLYV
jgi:catalase-peroxidase